MKSASINIYPEAVAYKFLDKNHFIWFKSGGWLSGKSC
jgi:hypothetical protein